MTLQIAPALTALLILFVGFLITESNIPDYYIWLYYINPYTYYLQGVEGAV